MFPSPKILKNRIPPWMVLGLLLFGINYIIAYRAQLYITSALTAIAFSSMVWMNIINARLFFGVRHR